MWTNINADQMQYCTKRHGMCREERRLYWPNVETRQPIWARPNRLKEMDLVSRKDGRISKLYLKMKIKTRGKRWTHMSSGGLSCTSVSLILFIVLVMPAFMFLGESLVHSKLSFRLPGVIRHVYIRGEHAWAAFNILRHVMIQRSNDDSAESSSGMVMSHLCEVLSLALKWLETRPVAPQYIVMLLKNDE